MDATTVEEQSEIETLREFNREVWGWLVERGLVSDDDDEWDGFATVIEMHEDEIAESARREAIRTLIETSNEDGTAAWVFTRENDPTYPKIFTDRDSASAHARACNVGPLPDVHLIRLSPSPDRAIRDDLVRPTGTPC